MKRRVFSAALYLLLAAVGSALAKPSSKPAPQDDILAEARKFVEKSDKYLHHSRLRRGDKGYGLTVMAGTKLERFDVEIVSVATNWSPKQDVILARLKGLGLDKSGIVSGMSGSPVYMKDPRDGKFKMIGAVAYGWSFQNSPPLCGIQPITQMLAVGRAFEPGKKSTKKKVVASRPAKNAVTGGDGGRLLAAVLDPRKADFTELLIPTRRNGDGSTAGEFRALKTPLMVSGITGRGLEQLRRRLKGTGLKPVRSGGVGAAGKNAAAAKLEPGAAVSIVLVRGDADWNAVGTVTDVIGKKVLMFGHSFEATGELALPMGPASIHTIMSSQYTSFKLGATLRITGATDHDEYTAVSGVIGNKATMIPLHVSVNWKSIGQKQKFRYEVCRHRVYGAVFPRYLVMESVWAMRELPERHTVRYDVKVDYGKFGVYRAANVSTGGDVYDVLSDVSRPLAAMGSNIFAPARFPERIDVDITIEKGQINASIMALRLDAAIWRPGERVTGKLVIRPTRKPRRSIPVTFDLPDDLPEGDYTLEACDAYRSLSREQSENPHKFDPRNEEELFAAVKRVVAPRQDVLYLRMPLRKPHLALGEMELPYLPPSRSKILTEAKLPRTKTFQRSIVRTLPMKNVLFGSATANFKVRKKPREILLRK